MIESKRKLFISLRNSHPDMTEKKLCEIDILRLGEAYIARITFRSGKVKEARSYQFENILEQLVTELQDEYEPLF